MTHSLVHLPLKALHRRLRQAGLPAPSGEPCETPTLVYALVEPDSDAVRYVGQSTCGLKRPRHHGRISSLLIDRTPKAEWIASLMRRNTTYRIAILVWGIRPIDLSDVEKACIRFYRNRGSALLNLTRGGSGQKPRRPGRPRPTVFEREDDADYERRLQDRADEQTRRLHAEGDLLCYEFVVEPLPTRWR